MTRATRTEEDLLGARQVPLEAYWGVHTLRATENYRISGSTVGEEPAFVRGMVQVKKASALANRELGTLTSEVAEAIVWACEPTGASTSSPSTSSKAARERVST